GSGHEGAHGSDAHGHGGGHQEVSLKLRIFRDLWLNNVFFTGIAIVGVFFIAFNYVAQAGWSAVIKRIPEGFGYFIPVAGGLMLIVFLLGYHDLFHWTHSYLYEVGGEHYDALLAGKRGYLNIGFFLVRMILYFVLWYFVWMMLRKYSVAEDLNPDVEYHNKS